MIVLHKLLIVNILISACVYGQGPKAQFRVIKEWDYINFTWPNFAVYNEAVRAKTYLPQNIIVAGVMYYESSFYMSLPRMRDGVPATIAKISKEGDSTPLLEPFPSWEMNTLGDCSAIQNSQNVEIDTKGRMWIIDSGRVETLSRNPKNVCKPKLVIYDIPHKSVVATHVFPEEVAGANSTYLYDLVVDESDGDYAYIADNSAKDPGIIVFSLKGNASWKIRHESMRADPQATQFKVDGISVTAPINVAGIALGPLAHRSNGTLAINVDRQLYYSPISSYNLYAIGTASLKNESYSKQSEFNGRVVDIGKKASQSDGIIMDNNGVLYYGLLGDSSIAKWDSRTPFASGQKVISRDAVYIQWPNSFTFDMSGNIVVLTNRLQKFIYGRMNVREPNFRLLSAHVDSKSYLYR